MERSIMKIKLKALSGVVLIGMLWLAGESCWGASLPHTPGKGRSGRAQVAAAADELRVHNVGKFRLSVTNYGIFGSESGGILDPCTRQAAPSAEFPAGTGVNYCFQGALWIGAIKGEGASAETLVTVGADGWESVNEMVAVAPFTTRTIRSAGIQQGSCFIPFSDSAISEQDFIAVYADTSTDPAQVDCDPNDGCPFVPLGLEITQKSYAWSYDYAQDFVLFDYLLINIGDTKLNNVYLGLYVDADNHNYNVDGDGFRDDVSGFKGSVPSFRCADQYEDTLNVAWTGDNEGLSRCGVCDDNKKGVFVPQYSPTSLAGTRVVKAPGEVKTSFNWWISETDATLDFGPWTQASLAKRPGKFDGVLGTPVGNENKYFIMSNGEFDYDQLTAALPIWVDSGWIPTSSIPNIVDVADGYDTRYFLSFGPFNINPGDTLPLTLAYIAGEDFHKRPSDWQIINGKFTDVKAVTDYYATKDFSDFASNARWAGWVYDNPGVDSDGDGDKGRYRICEGDTVYYEGDGTPDFAGPPPPDAPVLGFETSEGRVMVRWNGRHTENNLDYFSNEADFEGYRVWLSRTGLPDDYALLDSYDKLDYKMYVYNPGNQKWSLKLASLSPDSVYRLFSQDNGCCYFDGVSCVCLDSTICQDPFGFGNNLEEWTFANPYTYKGSCYPELEINPSVKVRTGDRLAFERQDWNQDMSPIKVYAAQIGQGVYTPLDSEYYEYAYSIDSLNPSSPVYIAVSAFDYGNPQTGLSPLETSPLVNSRQVWPLVSPAQVTSQKVVVFPNPYKITETYAGEDRNLPRGKRIHFVQLPGVCTIRIYTLDGDEVAVLRNEDPNNSEVNWNMVSANEQEVVAGVYIFQVESDKGNQIGKFVVVK
jgi:hypothetical protein